MKVVLLAAGIGRRFGKRTKTLPKCLIPISKGGQTLLSRYLDSFTGLGLHDIVLVVGHQKEKIMNACRAHLRARHAAPLLRIKFIHNPKYRLGSIVSLCAAAKELNDDCIIMDADVYFSTEVLKRLVASKKKTAFLIDPGSKSTGEEMMVMSKKGRPHIITKDVAGARRALPLRILGEATGFFKISKKDAPRLAKILQRLVGQGRTRVEYEESYTELMRSVEVGTVSVGNAFWTEMDFEADLKKIMAAMRSR